MKPERLHKTQYSRWVNSKDIYTSHNLPRRQLRIKFGMLPEMSKHEMLKKLQAGIAPNSVKRVILD